MLLLNLQGKTAPLNLLQRKPIKRSRLTRAKVPVSRSMAVRNKTMIR